MAATQRHIQCIPGTLSPRTTRQRRKADHSHQCSADVKNGGAIPPLPIRLHSLVRNELAQEQH
jgi:hypothetical protein